MSGASNRGRRRPYWDGWLPVTLLFVASATLTKLLGLWPSEFPFAALMLWWLFMLMLWFVLMRVIWWACGNA